ncbi:hypothetical protein GCK72_018556 [Caenorhabditis remanei]|uniref:W02B3.4-like N-terminal domain-containing protein n=1 Tax=Caenorhabditis remanei TaxID=31234 RepID=A0A6A5GC47_CAERE|nr:hypothetical protein GCK72_018556 [Caenorhabditis remanei]KAF1752002.1 hypothetical protein GCK72_018556 [Caenorhabditis remanei]
MLHSGNGFVRTMILSDKCEKWIQNSIQLPIPALLVDQNILQQLQLNICNKMRLNRKIKIAVDAENFGSSKFDFENFELLRFYNHTDKDYLVFEVSSENKIIIPKNFSYKINNNLKVPTQISLFLDLWNRGNFVNCRNMTMRRDSTKKGIYTMLRNVLLPPRKPIPVLESVRTLAQLRDEMLKFGIFPFLNGGTFLGWYRECSVIPHTTDMDIAVFAENWNLQFSEFMWTHNSSFRVKRQLGLVNDSYELTLVPKNGFETPVDVFLMYKEIENGKENRWVGGLTTTGIKYKYMYPEYDPWCAADLMGHLFWVSCTPEDKIQKEYGNTWYLDENSSKYIWNAAQNAVENGRFSREQMKTETYNEYKINDFS